MQRLASFGIACVAGFALLACSSDADPVDQGEFYKGEQVTPGAVGTPSEFEPAFKGADYPAGPYGTNIGSTIANYKFLGWHAPAVAGYDDTKFEDLSFSDFYDPTGEKGIKIIMLNSSALWCTVCRAEYTHFKNDNIYAKYKAMGAEFVGAIFEGNYPTDPTQGPPPATPGDLAWWGQTYAVEFPLILDPGFKTGRFFTADATPMNLLISARDMKIIGLYLGGGTGPMFAQLEQFVAEN